MKANKISFLAVALATLTLSSCSKEVQVEEAPLGEATISVSFIESSNTRVISDAVDATDEAINDVSIFVFRESGVHDAPRVYLPGFASDVVQQIDATTAAKRVYVVANVGNAAAHSAMFSAVTDENTLKTLVKDRKVNLYSMADVAGQTDIRATDVLMTGSGIVSAFVAGTNPSATVAVALDFPLSKIKLVVKDNRINNLDPAAVISTGLIAIEDQKVILINAGKEVKFFTVDGGLDQAAQLDFYTGIYSADVASGFMQYFTDDAKTSKATWLTGNDGTSGGSTNAVITHHFYTAANNAVNSPTILAIESTKTIWDDASSTAKANTVYYPIQFTVADGGNTLLPGKSYTVTLTLNGDISTGGGGGVIDPEIPVIDGTIDATITVAAWEPVAIIKELH